MSRFALSNLVVHSNLLDYETHPQAILTCTVFEFHDARRRLPNLLAEVPGHLQEENRRALFWGDRPPEPLDPRWPDAFAGGLAGAVPALEERSTEEDAFEALLLCRQIYAGQPDEALRERAADWDRRLRVLLEREFRLTDDMAERRLESVLGRVVPGPARPAPAPALVRPAVAAAPAAPVPALVAVRTPPSRTPNLFDTGPAKAAPAPPAAPVPTRPADPDPDSDLERLTRSWPALPGHVKKCILLLVDAAEKTAPE